MASGVNDKTAAADHGPQVYYQHISSTVRGKNLERGVSEGWVAPIAIFDALHGFDESAWIESSPTTALASRLAGSDVTWCWGKLSGRSSANSSSQTATCLQASGMPNHAKCEGAIKFSHIYLPDWLIDKVSDSIRPGVKASSNLRDDLVFNFDRAFETQISKYVDAATSSASTLEQEARAILLVATLLRSYHGFAPPKTVRGGLTPRALTRVCDAMLANLSSEMSLNELAAVAGCSPTHFIRSFKQSTGLAPFQWIALKRIEWAKRLLSDATIPIAQIGISVGYAAQPQFTTAFRRITGVTPGAWRRKL